MMLCTAVLDGSIFVLIVFMLWLGVYKPRVRCYDVAQMSMKFERCMDSEVIRFQLLNDDYTKVEFFQITTSLFTAL